MAKLSDLWQAHRSKNIAKDKSRLERLENKKYQDEKEEKRIDNLKGRIARNEKLNDLAQQNAERKAQIQSSKASATKVDNSHKEINYTDNSKKGVNDNHLEVASNNHKFEPPVPKAPTDKKGSKKPTTKRTDKKDTQKTNKKKK